MATAITSPIVDIAKGFMFKIYIDEAKNKQYIAVLRLHGRKFGVVTSVGTDGYAVWTEAQTLTLKRGRYDLEVWNSSTGSDTGHKLFTQKNIGRVKETYASMNGKKASDITY